MKLDNKRLLEKLKKKNRGNAALIKEIDMLIEDR